MDIEKFKNWLLSKGAEILPCTNEYESLRFKGSEVGVLYKSGKVSGKYVYEAINAFKRNKHWSGAPINVGRNNSYKKEKKYLLVRDGTKCFYCDKEMGEDITVEHLIALSSGGKNTLANMVLAHQECNLKVNNMPIVDKVKFAISNRSSKNC